MPPPEIIAETALPFTLRFRFVTDSAEIPLLSRGMPYNGGQQTLGRNAPCSTIGSTNTLHSWAARAGSWPKPAACPQSPSAATAAGSAGRRARRSGRSSSPASRAWRRAGASSPATATAASGPEPPLHLCGILPACRGDPGLRRCPQRLHRPPLRRGLPQHLHCRPGRRVGAGLQKRLPRHPLCHPISQAAGRH